MVMFILSHDNDDAKEIALKEISWRWAWPEAAILSGLRRAAKWDEAYARVGPFFGSQKATSQARRPA